MMSVIASPLPRTGGLSTRRPTIATDGRSGRVPVPRRSAGGPAGAARAQTLLFLIEQHSALHASEREVGTMALLGERSAAARELAWIEAFALGRDASRTASIREIEAAAGAGRRWSRSRRGPRGNPSPARRAPPPPVQARPWHPGRPRRDDERSRRPSSARRASRWRASGRPDRDAGPAALGALGARALARASPPFQAAAALTFLLSMGQTVVVIPIAVATVGPLVAAASIAVIGLLALAATARWRGRRPKRRGPLPRRLLRPPGHQRPRPQRRGGSIAPGHRSVALPTLAAFVGLALLLNLAVALPAELWVLLLGALAVAVPLGKRRTASFGGLMALGLISTSCWRAQHLALVDAALGRAERPRAGPPKDIGLDLALGVIIGVLLGSYADPVYTVQIGRIVLPRDPGGTEYVRGGSLGWRRSSCSPRCSARRCSSAFQSASSPASRARRSTPLRTSSASAPSRSAS